MDKTIAGVFFLGTCVVLAVLLLTGTISPLVSGSVFALALIAVGGLSRGFRKEGR
jgi:hypothetical protein